MRQAKRAAAWHSGSPRKQHHAARACITHGLGSCQEASCSSIATFGPLRYPHNQACPVIAQVATLRLSTPLHIVSCSATGTGQGCQGMSSRSAPQLLRPERLQQIRLYRQAVPQRILRSVEGDEETVALRWGSRRDMVWLDESVCERPPCGTIQSHLQPIASTLGRTPCNSPPGPTSVAVS